METKSITRPCPFCKAECSRGARSCPSCSAQFPWTEELEEIRDLIREREVSRLRATSALVTEVFDAARGQGTVSISTLKGFVFAWLFPRTIIVLGSILAGLALGVQTYIIWNQTRLLEIQATAARIEEIDRLRERQTSIRQSTRKLKNISALMGAAAAHSLGLKATCAVDSGACETSLYDVMKLVSAYPSPKLERNRKTAVWIDLVNNSRVTSGKIQGFDSGTTSFLDDALDDALASCAVPEDEAFGLYARYRMLLSITRDTQPSKAPMSREEMQGTMDSFFNMTFGGPNEMVYGAAPISEMVEGFSILYASIADGTEKLIEACKERNASTVARLAKLEDDLRTGSEQGAK